MINKKLKLDKSFFGQINCLKVQLSKENDCYFHIGIKEKETWNWEKVKMSDTELGGIINLIKKDEGKCSFFHKFDNNSTQIWCNKSLDKFNIKISKSSKSLTIGEFEVLRILLERIIAIKNFT